MPDIIFRAIPTISVKTVTTCLLWYAVSTTTSQLTKRILTELPYPLFLSQCQFLVGATLAFATIIISQNVPHVSEHFPPGSVPAYNTQNRPVFSLAMLLKVFPLGLFQFVGKYFSLSATSLIPLATVSSIKALSPLVVVFGYRVVYNVSFPIVTYVSLIPLLFGVVLIILSDSVRNSHSDTNSLMSEYHEFNQQHLTGVMLCLLSTIVFAAQNIYGKQLITWDSTDERMRHPVSLVLHTDTRPSTPTPQNGMDEKQGTSLERDLRNDSSADRNNLCIPSKTNLGRLPFSTSDLSLDEMKENHLSSPPLQPQVSSSTLYTQAVLNSNTNAYNPFAFIVNKFELNKIAKPEKISIILYSSIIGSSFSIGGFLCNEFPQMYQQLTLQHSAENLVTTTTPVFSGVLILILLDSLSHFVQTLLALHLLGSIPALSYSIASMMKRIILILMSIILMVNRDQTASADSYIGNITVEQVIGISLIGIGLYSYDRWGSRTLRPN
ncbi:hypothetical protein CANMA_002223 [Candida margitis]|uniref:uncharacterized protein n=1 Tax=Candida margitis TaxID=1775924 RepID=UPI0022270779|nr:uncharacterized protein CANMA_002223 [Candida margitis]KAI5968787.1 hypothetical protein CANMA_002223 [Candida margitis]